jgi:hypothetical protein
VDDKGKNVLVRIYNRSYALISSAEIFERELRFYSKLNEADSVLRNLFAQLLDSSQDTRTLSTFPTTLHDAAGFLVLESSKYASLETHLKDLSNSIPSNMADLVLQYYVRRLLKSESLLFFGGF